MSKHNLHGFVTLHIFTECTWENRSITGAVFLQPPNLTASLEHTQLNSDGTSQLNVLWHYTY